MLSKQKRGLVVNKQVVPETFAEWKFVRPEFEDPKFNRITKLSVNLEKQSIWRKLQYRNPDNVNKKMVAPISKTILMPSPETYYMKFGTVNVFQTYSPELSTDFQIPEDHLLVELPLC